MTDNEEKAKYVKAESRHYLQGLVFVGYGLYKAEAVKGILSSH
jgi:hypothetical protein